MNAGRATVGLGLGLIVLWAVVGCGSVAASRMALGGSEGTEVDAQRKPRPAEPEPPLAVSDAQEEAAADKAEVAEVSETTATDAKSEVPEPSAFAVSPLRVGDIWSRIVDLEIAVQAPSSLQSQSPNLELRVKSHQELRFEVLALADDKLSKLALHYVEATSKTEMLGQQLSEKEPVAGKRYIVSFPGGIASVVSAQGSKPSSEEVDTVKDDADEPEENQLALKELAGLAAAGKGDLSPAAAAALAGGDQDEIKLTVAKASWQKLIQTSQSKPSAVLDVTFGLTSSGKPSGVKMDAQLNGIVTVEARPTRLQSMAVSGPITLVFAGPNGGNLDGKGKIKLNVSYRY